MSQARVLSNYPNASLTNKIINGCMRVDQRNAGASSVTFDANGKFPVDRFVGYASTDGAITGQQSSTAPSGFQKSIACTTTVADASLSASQYAVLAQHIEGINITDLDWGTVNAKAVTLSFWVRSSLTGTFGGAICNNGYNRSYPFIFTISSANTFELKTLTIPGDTTGAWLTDNNSGIRVFWGLGVGSTYSGTAGSWAGSQYLSATGTTSVIGTSGATFYITGVDLRKGSYSTAPTFDMRQYGQELALCQRYLPAVPVNTVGYSPTTGATIFVLPFPITTRTTPTGISLSSALSAYLLFNGSNGSSNPSSITFDSANQYMGTIQCTGTYTVGQGARVYGPTVFWTGCEL